MAVKPLGFLKKSVVFFLRSRRGRKFRGLLKTLSWVVQDEDHISGIPTEE